MESSSPLIHFDDLRASVLEDVAQRSVSDLTRTVNAPGKMDLLIGEALYAERSRLKRNRPGLFTRGRFKGDARLWSSVQSDLLRPAVEADRAVALDRIVRHYGEEIGGHFNPRVYNFAVHAVPFGLNWLLNAASMRRFVPWGMTQSLEGRMRVTGEIEALKKLSKKGTVLLVPTHQSNLDSVLIGYVIYLMGLPPFAYGGGLNLFSNPVLSFFMSNLGAYTVDRQKSNAIYKEVLKNYSTRILREGVHSIFFPGGGRCRSGAIENKLKLGLLGTGLEAQIENLKVGKPNPNVFVVPMVTSYHFVLEASSLIEDYLAEAGKARFIITDDESWQALKVLNFFWRFFKSQSSMTVRIGRAMDVFGNPVDDEGRSMGPNGTTVDPVKWLTTLGELKAQPERDREYTRELGQRIIQSFYRENTALTSHAVAFALFESLRKLYPELDLYRFLRLSLQQRMIPIDTFRQAARDLKVRLVALADHGGIHLSPEFLASEDWISDGLRNLGLLHEAAVVRIDDGAVFTEDMNLLYYYRNRLAGYGLSLLADPSQNSPGAYDRKGFLA